MAEFRQIILLACFGLGGMAAAGCGGQKPAAPAIEQGAIDAPGTTVDRYHGVAVADPYRALEDWSDERVQAWSDAQTAQARAYLDGLPARPELAVKLRGLLDAGEDSALYAPQFAGNGLFAIQKNPGAEQPSLVWFKDPSRLDNAQTILDLMAFDPSGHSAIDWYKPSHDGRRVAVSISVGGSERGALYVFDASSAERVVGPIPNVYNPTAGGDVAWDSDGEGFFYTRYPQEFEPDADEPSFHLKLRHHRIGDDWRKDPLALGEDFNKVAQIRLESDLETGRTLAWIQDGDSGRFAFYMHEAATGWRQFSGFEDGRFQAVFGDGDDLFVLSTDKAPRGKILRLSAGDLDWSKAVEIAPEQEDAALVHSYYSHSSPTMVWSSSRLFVRYQTGGPSEIRVFDRAGAAQPAPAQPPQSNAYGLTATLEGAIFAVESYVTPSSWRSYNTATGTTTPSSFNGKEGDKSDDGWSDITIRREFAVSADGTKVPYTVLLPAGLGNGPHPALVTGYGGFQTSIQPRFNSAWRALLDRGVVIVEANLRGGGEYGADWHEQGILTKKQNVFDDFIAVIQAVQRQGLSDPAHTAIIGASNGGLLMGAMIAQHPELVSAVVAKVGIYDMLRVELDPNGVFNIPEYGTVADEEQFKALYAYSPYHNIRDHVAYPAVLFTTGANDQRVNPMHSRKMTARLRTATAGGDPILLNASRDTGHGAGASLETKVNELADDYAFILSYIDDK